MPPRITQCFAGHNPDPALIELLSNERQVTKDTPPTFCFTPRTIRLYRSKTVSLLSRSSPSAGVPAEMHIYEHGPHGVGLAQDIPELSTWPKLLANWLKIRGLR